MACVALLNKCEVERGESRSRSLSLHPLEIVGSWQHLPVQVNSLIRYVVCSLLESITHVACTRYGSLILLRKSLWLLLWMIAFHVKRARRSLALCHVSLYSSAYHYHTHISYIYFCILSNDIYWLWYHVYDTFIFLLLSQWERAVGNHPRKGICKILWKLRCFRWRGKFVIV